MKQIWLAISLFVVLCLSSCNQMKMEEEQLDSGLNMEVSLSEGFSMDSIPKDTNYDPQIEWNTEEYGEISENTFLSVRTTPLSTFSADVDTASYANIRRMIINGSAIPSDAIRIEEMINYFNYHYKQPTGNNPFSVTTELSDCPWNEETKLLSIGIQAKDMDYSSLPPSNLVFLLDVSGSMYDSNKLPLVINALKLLVEQLREEDRISIVTYAGMERVLLEGANGLQKEEIISVLESLEATGSTNGSAGIQTAYQLAKQYYIEGGNNRILLATDGDLNVGITSEGELKKLVEEKRKQGVYLSVLGFGTENIKDNKMEALADNGNGNYSYIDSILEARKVLVDEMGGTLFTIAKDVKFQVEFNPAVLKGYRLIGYENRLMASEDFNDDTKDAGEIGAGHRVTVLYELVPNNSSMEIEDIPLKYQDINLSTEQDWLTIKIRYKEPDENNSKLLEYIIKETDYKINPSENLIFAGCVAQFGMLLKESQFSGTATYSKIEQTLKQLSCIQEDGYKQEFLELVQQVKNRTKNKANKSASTP